MSAAALGALVTAGTLGVTHALEPDHVAGISSLTGRYGDARLSALVGACFSLGHAALVAVWLGVAALLFRHVPESAVLDQFGTAAAGVVLGAFGALLAVSGVRATVYGHDHGDVGRHYHVRLPFVGGAHDGHHADHEAGHPAGVRTYLRTGLVGALFTLSPPLSMLAFTSSILPQYGPDVVVLAVCTYAVTITATMSLVGAGAGTVFGLTHRVGARAHGVATFVAGVLAVGLAASMLVGVV